MVGIIGANTFETTGTNAFGTIGVTTVGTVGATLVVAQISIPNRNNYNDEHGWNNRIEHI